MNDTPDEKVRVPRWRRALVAILVILGCILAPLSILTVWLKSTLLNTDNYVATVAPLARDARIQNAIANRVTNAVVANNNVEGRIVERLPDNAKFIAPKISDALSSFVHDTTSTVVKSDQFATLWKEANRRAHARIVALLDGKGGKLLQTKNGDVTIDLGPIIDKVNGALESHGIHAFSNAASSSSDRQVVILQSVWLKRSQNITNLLQKLAIVLPILMLVCFGAAEWLSPNRRRTLLRSALGLALAMALLLIAFNGGRHFYLSALPSRVNAAAAGAVYDQLLGALKLSLRVAFVLALVVAAAAWVSGPARSATALREGVLHLVRGKGAAGGEASPFGLWIARNKHVLDVLAIALALIVLVFLPRPTPAQVIVTAALVLLFVLLLEFLARRAPAPAVSV
jgi:hypothetical protein